MQDVDVEGGKSSKSHSTDRELEENRQKKGEYIEDQCKQNPIYNYQDF